MVIFVGHGDLIVFATPPMQHLDFRGSEEVVVGTFLCCCSTSFLDINFMRF